MLIIILDPANKIVMNFTIFFFYSEVLLKRMAHSKSEKDVIRSACIEHLKYQTISPVVILF